MFTGLVSVVRLFLTQIFVCLPEKKEGLIVGNYHIINSLVFLWSILIT